MLPSLSHVALLVRSAQGAAEVCKSLNYELGPVEDFPSEGTREIYVGPSGDDGLLLLMEATGPGPYRKALEKRGPGVHHVAVNVASIEKYMAELTGTGWFLHTESIHLFTHRKTVYLARPGLGALIEVHEMSGKSAAPSSDRFVSEVFVQGDASQQRLLDALRVPGLHIANKEGAGLVIAGKRFAVAAFTHA